jgi:uncharacterized protein (DUF2249 family)
MNSSSQPVKISANTRISTVIRANPAAIEAIASINKHFEKLRNPILRKVLASRVTIGDAARIGGTGVDVFFDKLKGLGFIPEREGDAVVSSAVSTKPQMPPVGITLDARETLNKGQDPFKEIIAAAEQLPKNKSLLIINTFEPIPLLAVLRKKGFSHYTSQVEPNLVNTYFFRSSQEEANDQINKETVPVLNLANNFESLRQQYQNHLVEIDVRDLEMPQPMITILEALPKMAPEQALLVYHRRVPQYLLPQLPERGYAFAIAEPAPNEVRLLIYKNSGDESDNS